MARFRLDLEYVGTRYSGWQAQKNARTVQGALHEAVRRLSGRADFDSYGSGRTDAGVHALQQVAHLDLETRLGPEPLRRGLNDGLPADIDVWRVAKVTRQFHARHSAASRSYLYQVALRRTAFGKPFVWWVREALDARAVAECGRVFEGMHDFASYADASAPERSTRVKVERVQVERAGELLLVRVTASHFLWRMVRRMVGVMVEVGRGGLRVQDAERFLDEPSSVPATLTAPPSGLFLERVSYPGDPRPGPLRPVLNL
ncbi:MAG TPA: tRNA pseudouridine(38-40) synthase TruA [Vicinamibacteria bacterium]|nr:tRNA pseudouridine(38-40) synthase TruA [Vicinamibacteria bacterium]